MEVCQDLLHQFEAEGEKFLDSIVTGDETWCQQYEPESKRQSKIGGIIYGTTLVHRTFTSAEFPHGHLRFPKPPPESVMVTPYKLRVPSMGW
jgi:hypothetical protein